MLLIYLPNVTGANPENLFLVGLGELLDPGAPPTFADVLDPDRHGLPAPGVIAYWGAGIPALMDYEFQAAKPKSKGFWLGKPKQGLITPAELGRPKQHPGTEITLADGQAWLIPLARQLPHVIGLDDDGRLVGQVVAQYREFWDVAWRSLHWFVPDEAGRCAIDFESGFDLVVRALAVNYRVNRDVAAFLGLVSSDLFWPVARAVVEFDQISEVLAQKKTVPGQEPSSASGTPSTAAGASAS